MLGGRSGVEVEIEGRLCNMPRFAEVSFGLLLCLDRLGVSFHDVETTDRSCLIVLDRA